MDDLDDFDVSMNEKRITVYRAGRSDSARVLFVQPGWTKDDLLCAASQRLEMVPTAKYMFNADGQEVEDIMCVDDNEIVIVSSSKTFRPLGGPANEGQHGKHKAAQFIGGYRLGEILGKGGFGEVIRGTHDLTGEVVAMKFIPKNEIGDLGEAERTITEIRCLVALQHQHIIKLLRVLNESNHIVLIFEYISGGDLLGFMNQQSEKKISESEARRIFKQVLSGVGYAHTHHVCHRDLKLENILISNSQGSVDVKIADFGLSDFYRPGDVRKTTCGTLSYLAPEIFSGSSIKGPPLDVWSLGVILFGMLNGRLPFDSGGAASSAATIRQQILSGNYTMDIGISSSAADLIGRMLTVDVESRITLPDIFQHEWLRQCQGSIEERVLEMKKMNLVSPAGISSVLSITDLIEMESKALDQIQTQESASKEETHKTTTQPTEEKDPATEVAVKGATITASSRTRDDITVRPLCRTKMDSRSPHPSPKRSSTQSKQLYGAGQAGLVRPATCASPNRRKVTESSPRKLQSAARSWLTN